MGDAQNRDTAATRQKPKYGAKISLKAHVAGMKAFEKRAHAMCCKFVLKNIQLILSKHFEAPVLFWDEQSGIFGKASESSLRRSRTNISRDFV